MDFRAYHIGVTEVTLRKYTLGSNPPTIRDVINPRVFLSQKEGANDKNRNYGRRSILS